jgi:hypothetical protein
LAAALPLAHQALHAFHWSFAQYVYQAPPPDDWMPLLTRAGLAPA